MYLWGSYWAAARWVDPHSCPPHGKGLCRGFDWVQSHRWQTDALNTISRLCLWNSLWEQEKEVDPILQGQVRGWGASNCLGPVHRSTGGHVFFMSSLNIPRQMHTNSCPGEFSLYSEGSDKGWVFIEWQTIAFMPASKCAQFENSGRPRSRVY